MITDLSEVLEKIDIEAYLDREGVDYRETHGSSGQQLNIRTCPVCGGDKWKVFINANSGLGNCFSGSCETKFNKFKFIKAHTGLGGRDLFEHIESVASELGWRPPRKSTVSVDVDSSELKLPSSLEFPIRGRNLQYLENRNITLDIVKYFNLRFCNKGWFKYKIEEKECFMKFDKRVIIPIFDIDGSLVSFQGRDITGTAEKKYLFPPGFASTGAHLFNSHNAHSTKRVVVGEGVFDVMALKIALDEDVDLRDVVPIGTFGKHLAQRQLEKFQELKERGIEEVTIMWDGELEATDAAIKSGMLIRGLGMKVRIAMLPYGKDPNEVAASVVRESYWAAKSLTAASATKLMIQRRNEVIPKDY